VNNIRVTVESTPSWVWKTDIAVVDNLFTIKANRLALQLRHKAAPEAIRRRADRERLTKRRRWISETA